MFSRRILLSISMGTFKFLSVFRVFMCSSTFRASSTTSTSLRFLFSRSILPGPSSLTFSLLYSCKSTALPNPSYTFLFLLKGLRTSYIPFFTRVTMVGMAGRPLQLLQEKISRIKTSGGNNPQLVVFFVPYHGTLYPNDCLGPFWNDVCAQYHLNYIDLTDSFNALRLSYYPT